MIADAPAEEAPVEEAEVEGSVDEAPEAPEVDVEETQSSNETKEEE